MKKIILALTLGLGATLTAGLAMAENPKVKLETNMGAITVELYPDKAPKTVQNFLDYVNSGFYEGTIFHRVINGFMVQGGGFSQDYAQKQTKAPVQNEADNGLTNDRGTLAMARTNDPHSATAQFFINVVDNGFLNHSGKTPRGWGYAVFGKVTEGMEVVDQIKAVQTGARGPFGQDVPMSPIVIKKATVLGKAPGKGEKTK